MVYIKTKPIIDLYWIFGTVLFIPTFILGLQARGQHAFDVDFIKTTAYFLSIYVVVLTILGHVFKRNYLSIFFGCHERCDRSISSLQSIIPVCARCTGIYFGLILTIGLAYLNWPFYVFIPLGIPLIIDGWIQLKGKESTNFRRLFTGILFGPAMVAIFGLYNITVVYLVQQFIQLIQK